MTDFAGALVDATGRLAPLNRTADLGTATFTADFPLSIDSPALGASRGVPQPAISSTHWTLSGRKRETFGGQLFDKVIVLPRVKALGFVLTATQFAVEVWNAFRETHQVLSAISITGAGGLAVADPLGEPLLYASLDSYTY